MKKLLLSGLIIWVLFFCAYSLVAQTNQIQVLMSFSGTNGSYEGSDPKGSMIMSGSTLYGFTSAGGGNGDGGVIFSFDTVSSNYSVLASFSTNINLSGDQPHHGYLTLDGATIIRPMFMGGSNNAGTIFSVSTNGIYQSTSLTFSGGANDGSQPHSGLLALSNQLYYGITALGGANNGGTIYTYNASTTNYSLVYSFSTNTGYNSHGQLIWNSADTLLYGMTREGGTGVGNANTSGIKAPGVIFSFNPTTTNYTVLYNFTSVGTSPYFTDHGILALGTGVHATTLFGMTEYGGLYDKGAIFALNSSGSSSLTILHSFGATADASEPYGSLVLNTNNGYFYGMTSSGGSSHKGTIFCINQDGSIYSVLASFDTNTGADPIDNVTFNSNNTMLYGLTQSGGASNDGTLFSLDIPQSCTNTGMITYTNTTVMTTLSVQHGVTSIAPGVIINPVNATIVSGGTLVDNGTITTPILTVQSGGVFSLLGATLNGNLNNTLGGTVVTDPSTINGNVNNSGSFTVVGLNNIINGTLTLTSSSTLTMGTGSQLTVNGSATLGGTFVVANAMPFGTKFTFLTSTGAIKGTFSSIIAPAGERGRLVIEGDPTASIIIAPQSYTQMAANQNQVNVATALNSFIPATSGDQQVVSTSLDSLTASQYNQAFNAIMPTFYQQVATIAFNEANALNMELNQRLWGLRLAEGGGFSMSGLAENYPMIQEGQGDGGKGVLDAKKDILRPGLDNHWGLFVDGNGIFSQANSANMLPGYNSESGGITTGLTYKWNDKVASGIYAGYQGTYTKSGANGSGLGTGSSLTDNAVRFGVFGTYGNKDGKGLYLNALAGGAYHNYQATRVIQYTGIDRTANSQPGAGELDSMLATGYDIQKGKFTFGPTASLQYTYLGVNSLNETGAQSLNYNSGGWNSSSMLSSMGAHAAYNWIAHHGSGGDIVVVPQINLNWQHEFMQNPYDISGNLGGTSPTFSNWSAAPIRDFLYTGVGFTVDIGKRWNTSFFYNAAAGNQNLTSQNIFWSAGVKF